MIYGSAQTSCQPVKNGINLFPYKFLYTFSHVITFIFTPRIELYLNLD